MTIKVVLLGMGTVGTQVARILLEDELQLSRRAEAGIELVRIVVNDVEKPRYIAGARKVNPELITGDALSAIEEADIVVELIGGVEPARLFVNDAIVNGKNVVTGNKALIAHSGGELLESAAKRGVQLLYEAAVAGAIPILRPIQDNLAGDNIVRVMGIVNGTTNYILDRMDVRGLEFSQALAEAQEAGYAEADPTADIAGHDAASKAAILATLAFHTQVPIDKVYREGIAGITAADILSARQAGYVIKLLAICEKRFGGIGNNADACAIDKVAGVSVRVHPTLVPDTHPLASVHGAFNAVFVEAENAGEIMFYGQGAGGAPTASAVMGDIITVARRIAQGGRSFVPAVRENYRVLGMEEVITSYAITVQAADESGVLAQVAGVFADHGVSLETVRQEKNSQGASIYMVTHKAKDSVLAQTVSAIKALETIKAVVATIRVG